MQTTVWFPRSILDAQFLNDLSQGGMLFGDRPSANKRVSWL